MMGGVWHRDTISWLMAAAAIPAAAAAIGTFGIVALAHMAIAMFVIIFWQLVFLWTRAQPVSPIAIVTAIAVGVLAPGEFSAWQIVLAVSFGTVIGEQIFGGWGRNIINAGTVTLAFLYFAFPQTPHPGGDLLLGLSVVPGALMLLVTGILSWQLLLAAVACAIAVSFGLGGAPDVMFSQGTVVFGLVFLAADPVASSATRSGRWIYGALVGATLALFGWTSAGFDGPKAIVFASLVSSLFAPLIDTAVIAATARLWRPRNG